MKKIRVFCTDPDATDSSSDDENDNIRGKPAKKKRFVREIIIGEPPQEEPMMRLSEAGKAVKYKGVRQRKWGKFAAEIRHPINKVRLWLGTFNSAEEAYEVYYMKKLEFEALRSSEKSCSSVQLNSGNIVNDNNGMAVEGKSCCAVELKPDDLANLNGKDDNVGKSCSVELKTDDLPNLSGKDDPGKSSPVDLKSDYLANSSGKYDMGNSCCVELKSGTIGEIRNEVMDLPAGVKKAKSGKWTARIKNPKTREWKWLGTFNFVEEAIRVYKKKEGEFEEFKGKEKISEEPCEGDIYGVEGCNRRKFCCIVRKSGDGRWEARVWHPKLKTCVMVGTYDRYKQAEIVANLKKDQLQKRFRSKKRRIPSPKRVDQSRRQECGSWNNRVVHDKREIVIGLTAPRLSNEREAMKERATNLDFVKAMNGEKSVDGNLAAGIRMTKTSSDGAWVTPLEPGTEHCLHSCKTLEEAVKSVNKETTKFEEIVKSEKSVSFDNQVITTPVKAEQCGFIYGSPTSVLDAEIESSGTVSGELTNEVVHAPVKLEHDLVHGLPTLVYDAETVNGEYANVHDAKAHDTSSENQENLAPLSFFDEAVRLGFMNQYGQLLGEYSKYDEPIWLSNDDEEEGATYYY